MERVPMIQKSSMLPRVTGGVAVIAIRLHDWVRPCVSIPAGRSKFGGPGGQLENIAVKTFVFYERRGI